MKFLATKILENESKKICIHQLTDVVKMAFDQSAYNIGFISRNA